MSQESPATAPPPAPPEPAPSSGRGSRIGAGILAALIVGSLVLYFVGTGSRPTPRRRGCRRS